MDLVPLVDDESVTWLETIPKSQRAKSALLRVGAGLVVSLLIWLAQFFSEKEIELAPILIGFIPIFIGAFFALKVFNRLVVRRYAVVSFGLTRDERIKDARGLAIFAVGYCLIIAIALVASGSLSTNWPLLLPGFFFCFLAVWVFFQKGNAVLTPQAAEVKSHFEALEKKAVEARNLALEKKLNAPSVRYPFACLIAFLSFAFADEIIEGDRLFPWLLGAAILYLIREAFLWVAGISIVVGVVILVWHGVGALPVSVAIIIGALIIAAAVAK
jgi:hypothetical protein